MNKEEIEKWLEKQDNIIWGDNLVNALYELLQNFVSKDKIKAKIEEFEKPLLDIAEEQKFSFKYTLDGLSAIQDGVKKVLEDLLKESKTWQQ